jgi:hypothetical protein
MQRAIRRLRRRVATTILSEALFPRVCRLLGPTLSGWLCSFRVDCPVSPLVTGERYLFVARDVAYKDLDELRVRSSGEWFSYAQSFLHLALRAWLPRDFFVQLEFQERLQNDQSLDVVRPLKFATSLLRSLVRRHGIAAILSSNVDYAQDEFLRRAGKALGLPFFVLLKEHVNTSYGMSVWSKEYERTGYRFEGDGVAVFGQSTRDILIRNGVLSGERISVTGPPRFDAWRDVEPSGATDVLVLCAFSHPHQEGASSFPAVVSAFSAAAASAGAAGSGSRFVVKCRDHYEIARVAKMLPAVHRLELVSDVSISSLFLRARLVVGFGSLALVEALFSGAAIATPRFGSCTNDQDVQFDESDPLVSKVVCFLRTESDLQALVADFASGLRRPLGTDADRRQLITKFFCEPAPTYSALLDAQLAHWSSSLGDEAT